MVVMDNRGGSMETKYKVSTTVRKGGTAGIYYTVAFSLIQKFAAWLCVTFDSIVDLVNSLQDTIVINEALVAGALMTLTVGLYASIRNSLKNSVFPKLKRRRPWLCAAVDTVEKWL